MSRTHPVLVVSHAPPTAYAPMTLTILAKLGYAIVDPEEFASRRDREDDLRPELRLVDERHLAEVDEDEEPSVPIVLLTGRHGVSGADPRIVGALRRPAGMHDLYRIFQQILEQTPRSSPRVETHLRATCRRDGREWSGALLSISENGCLVRSPEPLPLGSRFELTFTLSGEGELTVEGEVSYQLLPDLGVVFNGTPARVREAIVTYVKGALAA